MSCSIHADQRCLPSQVWKREQKQAAEQKKLEELRKQYEEDRKNQEMTQIAEAAGYR
jgi:hypothetical protein